MALDGEPSIIKKVINPRNVFYVFLAFTTPAKSDTGILEQAGGTLNGGESTVEMGQNLQRTVDLPEILQLLNRPDDLIIEDLQLEVAVLSQNIYASSEQISNEEDILRQRVSRGFVSQEEAETYIELLYEINDRRENLKRVANTIISRMTEGVDRSEIFGQLYHFNESMQDLDELQIRADDEGARLLAGTRL